MALKLLDIRKLLRIDSIIRRRSSGTPLEFAKKMDFSRSTLFEYLAYLKDEFTAVIHYNKYSHNYEYIEEPEGLYVSQSKKEILPSDYIELVQGGVAAGECQCSLCHKKDCPNRRE